uniref:WAP domain-containing protein n=1 Tax=Periophthalmus magnuspinnatus TaxID=409849 RepID=A0A3B4BL70_9GOBI
TSPTHKRLQEQKLSFFANSLFPVHLEKLGVCPEPNQGNDPAVVSCPNQCSTDSDCGGIQKCCFNGCGRVCKDPRGNMSLRNTCGG